MQGQMQAKQIAQAKQAKKVAQTKKVALYVRRSTDKQEESNETQLGLLEAEAEKQGWEIQARYRETKNGTIPAKDRPAFRQLIGAIRRGEVDTVAVAHFDRLGRTMRDMVETYNLFKDLGVGFVSLAEPFLNSHPDDDFSTAPLIASILSWASEYNRRQILKRTAEGRERAKARGVKFGRERMEIDRKKLARAIARGASVRDVAKALGVSRGKAHKEIVALRAETHTARELAETHTAIAPGSRKK